ncbi:uncharacterized protein LOC144055586 isoform X2 [Vanacampus margaritifer]
MWSRKMAAQWRPIDEVLNAGNVEFLSTRSPYQIGPCGSNMGGEDTQSSMEHSILAIFEDSALSSEDTRQAAEENETLLSALTQMLECVEDDVGSTLSPFDTLPDTKLLNCQEFGNSMTTDKIAFAAKLRPRAKNDTRKGDKSKVARLQPVFRQQSRTLFKDPNKKADTEVNVFTSSSLVNLVKLMHPYCLKMHVEEEGKSHQSTDGPSQSPWEEVHKENAMFSQGEIWKYEKPTGDSDEDINVVSDDDDTPLKETQEDKEDVANTDSTLLKSALFTSKSSSCVFLGAKKRVSFGPVQVASFDQSVEAEFNEKTPSSVASGDTPEGPVFVGPSISLEMNNVAEDSLAKCQVKAKSLSLQEYRQLRQKRQPRLEKKGSNTTKWPSVPQPPKELTPILCSHGQSQNLCEVKISPHLKSTNSIYPPQKATCRTSCRQPSEPREKKPLFAGRHCRFKSPQIKSKRTSLDGSKSNSERTSTPVKRAASKKSTLKNPTLLSTDPPNPVIIRLPVSQMATPANCHSSPVSSAEPHPSQEAEGQFPITPQTKPQNITLVPKISQPESPHSFRCDEQSAAAESGIEACDLTSLLERFEEKQAEEGEPAIFSNVLPPNLHEDSERTSTLMQTSTKEHKPDRTLYSLRPKSNENDVEQSEHVTPEPVGTEVILDTEEVVIRRKMTPSKGVQIIDPRPLPSRKTNSSELAAPAHICSLVFVDHDYCAPADSLHTRAPPLLKNTREMEEKCDSSIRADEKHQSSSSTCTDPAPPCTPLTPPPSPPSRGREKRRYLRRSRLSDSFRSSSSSSSSESRSPKRRRSHHECSRSRSWSSSPSRSASRSPSLRRKLSCTRLRRNRSRSQSWSRSRSPSPSSPTFHTRRRNVCRESWKLQREHKARLQKLKAIDERRVVYVGRIRRSMTHEELRERFSHFGNVECVSLHFRDKGDHYGFVTFYHMDDAFAAIDNGGKLRKPDELPFDICFGGRRQFCNSDYADLDAKMDAEASPTKSRLRELDFDSLLKQAQKGLR